MSSWRNLKTISGSPAGKPDSVPALEFGLERELGRCQQFFIALQQSGRDWLFLGTTKTGLVYRLKGNPPQSHE
jgi:hypothetical protein